VAAVGGFIVEDRMARSLQRCGHLSRVTRMHPIIVGRRGDQYWRILAFGGDVLVRRLPLDELPFGRLVGVAELRDPGGAGKK
jgi:hypothetical protein